MKTWIRVRLTVLCGSCGEHIRQGAPALQIAGSAWTVLRCERCAGEAVPAIIADQPSQATVIRADFGERIDSMRGTRTLAKDWKLAQAGER